MYEMQGGGVENRDDLWPPFGRDLPQRGNLPRRPPSGRDAPLSRQEIVRAAVMVADAEGAEAVNMRRISRELGVGTMSLYWHVADKQQLLDLMLDEVEGEDEAVERSGDWLDDLGRRARARRAGLLRHRWVMDFIGGRPPLGPNTLSALERDMALLDGVAIDTRTALDVLSTVDTYVLGAVLREMREMRSEQDQEQSGLDADEIRAGMLQWRTRLEQSGLFPRFLRIFEEDIDPDAPETRDDRFEFGLRCVLDGIAARVEGRA